MSEDGTDTAPKTAHDEVSATSTSIRVCQRMVATMITRESSSPTTASATWNNGTPTPAIPSSIATIPMRVPFGYLFSYLLPPTSDGNDNNGDIIVHTSINGYTTTMPLFIFVRILIACACSQFQ
jgi:hypothetical protein